MQTIIPNIEADIPLPFDAIEALPELSPKEELDMRARTIKLLSDLNGSSIEPDAQDIEQAQVLARKMMQDPKMRPEYARYPNETMAYLAGMVSQSNCQIVDELSEFKLYVVNKLVYEIEHAQNAKDRLSAIKSLGEVDGVDAFKKRSELTIKVQTLEEVEEQLLATLNDIEYHVVEDVVEEQEIEDCLPQD